MISVKTPFENEGTTSPSAIEDERDIMAGTRLGMKPDSSMARAIFPRVAAATLEGSLK